MKVNIIVNGNKCKQYFHDGKVYIEAKEGSEYSIELKNSEYNRKLAVVSVDGLNVITGDPCAEKDAGYIVNNSIKIDGFRISDDEVAKFKFTTKNKSYAASKDDPTLKNNMGVIGILVYNEKVKYRPYYKSNLDYISTDSTQPYNLPPHAGPIYGHSMSDIHSSTKMVLCSTTSQPVSNDAVMRGNFDMGTTWGEAKESKVITSSFEVDTLQSEVVIYYASREELINMGVPISSHKEITYPQPFKKKYAEPPPGWQR
jgi:hypothetical protein